MENRRSNTGKPTWLRYGGVGFEFAAAVAGFALVGYWVDRHYGTSPWGVIIGVMLGLTGGTYNLIRESMAAFRQFEKVDRDKKREGENANRNS